MRYVILFLLFVSTLTAPSAAAQEMPSGICYGTVKNPAQSASIRLRTFLAQWNPDRNSVPNLSPWPPFSQPDSEPLIQEEAPGFSFWGYRHRELHALGLIEQLQERTQHKCCNSVESGECRVTSVNMPSKEVLIDGKWCPISKDTRIAALEGLGEIADGNETIAIVCAARSYSPMVCPPAYCIGVEVRM